MRNALKTAQLDAKWQQKKTDITKQKDRELSIEERQLQMYQQDAEKMRKSNWIAELMNRLRAGETLTEEEQQYLERNNPQALKEYEDIRRERAAYREEVKKCKSKEEAEKLKMNKMNAFLSAVKAIDSNPNIPKAAKIGLMERIMRRLAGIEEEHAKFTRSFKYQNLPDETDTAEETGITEETAVPISDETTENKDSAGDTPTVTKEIGGGTDADSQCSGSEREAESDSRCEA